MEQEPKEPKEEWRIIKEWTEGGRKFRLARGMSARVGTKDQQAVFEQTYEEMRPGAWKEVPFGGCEIVREYMEDGQPRRVVVFLKQSQSAPYSEIETDVRAIQGKNEAGEWETLKIENESAEVDDPRLRT